MKKTVLLAVFFSLSLTLAAKAAEPKPSVMDAESREAIEKGQINAGIRTRNPLKDRIVEKNESEAPLAVKLPEIFTGSPILAQHWRESDFNAGSAEFRKNFRQWQNNSTYEQQREREKQNQQRAKQQQQEMMRRQIEENRRKSEMLKVRQERRLKSASDKWNDETRAAALTYVALIKADTSKLTLNDIYFGSVIICADKISKKNESCDLLSFAENMTDYWNKKLSTPVSRKVKDEWAGYHTYAKKMERKVKSSLKNTQTNLVAPDPNRNESVKISP